MNLTLESRNWSKKQQIARSFGKAAKEYHEASQAQRIDAIHFARWMEPFPTELPLIEVGCGTGHLTQHLLGSSLLATDIAPEMVAECRKRCGDQVEYEVVDGEQLHVASKSRIVSAWTVQWFSDPLKTLSSWARQGEVCVSLPVQGSFPEWRQATEEAGVEMSAERLPEGEELLDGLPVKAHHLHEIRLTYPSPFQFFRSLKRIGAGGCSTASPHALYKVSKTWGAPCSVTYKILYIFC